MFHLLQTAGYAFDDLIYKYTTDQVWLFYEKEHKRQLDHYHQLAIIIANAVSVAQPASDRSAAAKSSKNFEKFLESLDWRKLEKKAYAKPDPLKAFSAVFGALGKK